MKERENLSLDTKGKRLGGWGMVEVDEDKRRWLYEDDPEGAKALKERERKAAERSRESEKGMDFGRVTRYEMSAKRIW
jgi:predicted RNA-binding protein with PUA domain